MNQSHKPRNISPKVNKFLLVLNSVVFVAAVVLLVLNLRIEEWVLAGGMAFAALVAGLNAYGCWMRMKGRIS